VDRFTLHHRLAAAVVAELGPIQAAEPAFAAPLDGEYRGWAIERESCRGQPLWLKMNL
jgi:hypothetical protein